MYGRCIKSYIINIPTFRGGTYSLKQVVFEQGIVYSFTIDENMLKYTKGSCVLKFKKHEWDRYFKEVKENPMEEKQNE